MPPPPPPSPAAPTTSDAGSTALVIGTGALGTAVAAALQAHGRPVAAWNRTPAGRAGVERLGVEVHDDLTTAVARSEVALVVVSTPGAAEEVLAPVLRQLAGRVVITLTSGTADDGRRMAAWLAAHDVAHLDAAAMSGTRLVGDPQALFLYGGALGTFERCEPTLRALGRAWFVGEDPGVVSVFDTALLTMNLGVLTGFYHAAALVRPTGTEPDAFAGIVAGYLPFVTDLLQQHAAQASEGRFPSDDGTLAVYDAALDHAITTSRSHGVSDALPTAVQALVRRAVDAGHGAEGLARLIDLMGAP